MVLFHPVISNVQKILEADSMLSSFIWLHLSPFLFCVCVQAKTILENLKSVFTEEIEGSVLMSNSTKTSAVEKVQLLLLHSGIVTDRAVCLVPDRDSGGAV